MLLLDGIVQLIGETLGPYRVTRQLGAGGMGVVYLAEHTVLGRRAAIKVLLPDFSRDADMVQRIFNEARAAASIEHPGMVDVWDFGHTPSGSAYIVMEYLDGESLAARLRREGRLPFDLSVAIARQVASAVSAAHVKGFVHRDLKPDNIFLVRDDELTAGVRAKVLDFGIAKLGGDLQPGSLKTRTGALMGTPTYMSPEQCRGTGQIDHRADVYALGCILFEMVCGRPPFTYQGLGELLAAHLYEEPPAPSSIQPATPGWLEAAIVRSLAKHPEGRPQTMDQLAAELGGRGSAPGRYAVAPPIDGRTIPMPSGATPPPGAFTPAAGAPSAGVAAAPGYPPAPGPLTPHGASAHPHPGGYPPAPGGYPPTPGGYPPTPSGYPPASGGYPPAPGGYTPAPGPFAAAPVTTTLSRAASEVSSDGQRRHGKLGWVVAGAGLALVAGVVLFVTRPRGDEASSTQAQVVASEPSATSPGAPVPAPTPAAETATASASTGTAPPPVDAPAPTTDPAATTAAEPPSPAPPAQVTLSVGSRPEGAEVFREVDGERVGVTPLELTVPAAPGTLALVLKRRGYEDARVELPASASGSVTAELQRRKRTKPKRLRDPNATLDPFAD